MLAATRSGRVLHFPSMATSASVCPVCGGTGWRAEADPRGPVVPCECRQREHTTRLLEAAGIPVKYRNCVLGPSFDTYWGGNEGKRNDSLWLALNSAEKYAAEYLPGEGRGLLFQGPPGVGKTHLLVGLLKRLCERGIECLFLDYQDLLRQIQNSYNTTVHTTEYELLQPVLSTEIVAIDDLGNNRISEWVEDTVTYVVNHRYSNNRPTLFTANLSEEGLQGKPGDRFTQATFLERLGPRVASRLKEMCTFVPLKAPDYRARR